MVLTMIGEGQAEYRGEVLSGAEAMKRAGIAPVTARRKGRPRADQRHAGDERDRRDCAFTTRCGLPRRRISSPRFPARRKAASPARLTRACNSLRGHAGQIACAKNLRALLKGSSLSENAPDQQGAGRVFHPLHSADSRREPGCDRLCLRRDLPRNQRRDRQPAHLSGRGRRHLRRQLPRPADGACARFSRHRAGGVCRCFRAAYRAAGEPLRSTTACPRF